MFKKLKNFIKKIQKSDLKTRKKWLYIFSGIIILFIVIVWRIYLGIVFDNRNQKDVFFKKALEEYQIFKKGWEEVKNNFNNQLKDQFKGIENELNKKKEIEIFQTSSLNNSNLETTTFNLNLLDNNLTSSLQTSTIQTSTSN